MILYQLACWTRYLRRAYETTAPYQYTTSNRLFNLTVGKLSWKRENVESTRKNCLVASSDEKEALIQENRCPNELGHSLTHVSASTCLDVPMAGSSRRQVSALDIQLTLPNKDKRTFLPIFHSCRISRIYTLDLRLSVGQTISTVSLVVPLQIGVKRDDSQL